jgi:hypothetical protein
MMLVTLLMVKGLKKFHLGKWPVSAGGSKLRDLCFYFLFFMK